MRQEKRDPIPPNSALGDALKAKGFAASPPPPEPDTLDLSRQGKLVLRRERKGRGGKTVTLVAGLSLPPAKLEELAKAMRKGLGCGSTAEDGMIVLQGDLIPRAEAWLAKQGATKIVRGN